MMSKFDTARREAMKALEGFNTGLVSEALTALPRLDAALFGEAWDERLAAAVGRLDRAEDIYHRRA